MYASNNEIEIPELQPVRTYKRARKDVLESFLRVAEGSNEGLNKRAQAFREHVVQVLGPEVFQKDRRTLLNDLMDEARSFGLPLHTNPDKVVDFIIENPVALNLTLGRLLHVPASYDTVTGLLADAIDSIVVRIVLNSTAEEVQQAQKKTASSPAGQDAPPFTPINLFEFGKVTNWKFDHLEHHTLKYLDKVIGNWGNNASVQELSDSADLQDAIKKNPPKADALPVSTKLKLVKDSNILALSKIAPILKSLDRTGNTVGDAVTAAIDSAVLGNALQWFATVGCDIDWVHRFTESPNRPPDVDTDEERNPTEPPQPVNRDAPTKVLRK